MSELLIKTSVSWQIQEGYSAIPFEVPGPRCSTALWYFHHGLICPAQGSLLLAAVVVLLCRLGFVVPTFLIQLPGARRRCVPVPKHFNFATAVSSAFVLLTSWTCHLNVFFKPDLSQLSCAVSEHFELFLHNISKKSLPPAQLHSRPGFCPWESERSLLSSVYAESSWRQLFKPVSLDLGPFSLLHQPPSHSVCFSHVPYVVILAGTSLPIAAVQFWSLSLCTHFSVHSVVFEGWKWGLFAVTLMDIGW